MDSFAFGWRRLSIMHKLHNVCGESFLQVNSLIYSVLRPPEADSEARVRELVITEGLLEAAWVTETTRSENRTVI